MDTNNENITEPILEDITNKDQTKEIKCVENIRIDIEFEQIDESGSGELQPTFTEIIAEKEMDLMRKSLEENDDDKEMDIINIPDDTPIIESVNKKATRSKMKKSYVDFLSDEEDFLWDSTSWKDTGDESTSSETNKSQKKKKLSSDNGKVGEVGVRKKTINKRKVAKRPKLIQQKYKTALPITSTKYKDLMKLCDTGVIPKLFHLEYSGFCHRNGKDVLVETDIEDEIETTTIAS